TGLRSSSRMNRGAWRRRAGAWDAIDPCETVPIEPRPLAPSTALATRQTLTPILLELLSALGAERHGDRAQRAPGGAAKLEREAQEGELVLLLGAHLAQVEDLDDRGAGGREHVGVHGQ